MNDELPVPVLTLTPTTVEKSQVRKVTSDVDYYEGNLTDEEKKAVDDFVKKIDIRDSGMIVKYGAEPQRKIGDYSSTVLSSVRNKDTGVGDILTNLSSELKGFSFDKEEKTGGFFGLFKKTVNKLDTLKTKFEKSETTIENICQELQSKQLVLLKDISMYDKMFEVNKVYYKELTMYILAGKKRLNYAENVELPKLLDTAQKSGRMEDAEIANDFKKLIHRFEKRIHDLDTSKTIAMQTGPQIRLIQDNNVVLSEKIQTMITNTIPIWKSQMVIAIGLAHSADAARATKAVSDTTNELLKRNAEKLHTVTVETARESERSIVDIETLKYTNERLLSTIDEVMQIHREGREARKQAEVELERIENDLKNKLLSIRE